jgi:hypothetical protein
MFKEAVLFFSAAIILIHGYPSYLSLIPNGRKVPNPCTEDPNDTWRLVGHEFAKYIEFVQKRTEDQNANRPKGKYVNLFGLVRKVLIFRMKIVELLYIFFYWLFHKLCADKIPIRIQ